MSTTRRTARTFSIALLTIAFLAPTQAFAAEAPTITDLTAETTTTAIAHSRAANNLEWVEVRRASTRERLALVESRIPDDPDDQGLVLARAFGAVFSPSLADEIDRLTADRRAKEALTAELDALEAERSVALAKVETTRTAVASARALLDAAKVADAERLHAERVAQFGIFPVSGPNEYIDSWGFARSGGRRHQGADIMAASGTPVVAVHDGVVRSNSNSLGGLVIWLQADNGSRYYYAHLDSAVVGAGRVSAGQLIGTVGDTGNARGGAAHLHFEIHEPGATNPYPLLRQMVG